ncbi:MAG: copper chaperone PCu(A)C, partial [Rhodanobacteraceae bacterium]
ANLPAAGYATIRNDGEKPVRLTGADSPDYRMAMLHRSVQKNGSDSMEVVGAIGIPAHGSVALAPGGYHLMLMDAKHPVKPGDSVHVSLHFDDGETLQMTWPVRPANAQ